MKNTRAGMLDLIGEDNKDFLVSVDLEYETRLWETYIRKHKKLNCCTRLYLWLRHKLVLEVMFKKTMNHLREMVEETRVGETFIMNNVDK
jgi:hypothetical protein